MNVQRLDWLNCEEAFDDRATFHLGVHQYFTYVFPPVQFSAGQQEKPAALSRSFHLGFKASSGVLSLSGWLIRATSAAETHNQINVRTNT